MKLLLVAVCLLGTTLGNFHREGDNGGPWYDVDASFPDVAVVTDLIQDLIEKASQGIESQDLAEAAANISLAAMSYLQRTGNNVPWRDSWNLIREIIIRYNITAIIPSHFVFPLKVEAEHFAKGIAFLKILADTTLELQASGESPRPAVVAIHSIARIIHRFATIADENITIYIQQSNEDNNVKERSVEKRREIIIIKTKKKQLLSSIFGKIPGVSSDRTTPDAAIRQFESNFVELQKKCQLIFDADPSQTHSDISLRRFLRGYVTVEAAFNAILKYNKWRKEYNVDGLSTEDPDILAELTKGTVHILRNRDKKNRPVLYVAVRKHIANDRDLDKMTKFTIYMLELTFKRLNEDIIDTICILFDLRKFTLSNMDYQFVKRLVWLLGKYYPERLGICLIYCAPLVFTGCWTVIRPWLNEVTASKVTFAANEEQLCQYMNPDCLPPSED